MLVIVVKINYFLVLQEITSCISSISKSIYMNYSANRFSYTKVNFNC